MSIEFLNVFPGLPANASATHAHILDVPDDYHTYEQRSKPKLWDGIVTMLFKISPDTLKMFLSPKIKSFRLIFHFDENPWGEHKFIIWRRRTEVLVGSFEVHVEENLYEWDMRAKCTIGYDGVWETHFASHRSYCKRSLAHAWKGPYFSYKQFKMHDAANEGVRNGIAVCLGEQILIDKLWNVRHTLETA
ncbi:hypothetical protein K504DRAFT_531707 [Pleomassaria siparia CBS 279.74]|uniref:Uncharacterized protein n=1 Tax=Pleomassaria siparia CBS 279.74 TaxID=1314801 RepID=A0A6G1KJ41_9PLEO|nr:hypothetical protein K504DRAFT_531707 [Pleomassaria siparia CBS 279.74]